MEKQLDFFSQQLSPHSLAASQACAAAAATDLSEECQVTMSMLRSYKLPRLTAAKPTEIEGFEGAMEPGSNSQASRRDDWALGAPWDSFANHGDPIGALYRCASAVLEF